MAEEIKFTAVVRKDRQGEKGGLEMQSSPVTGEFDTFNQVLNASRKTITAGGLEWDKITLIINRKRKPLEEPIEEEKASDN